MIGDELAQTVYSGVERELKGPLALIHGEHCLSCGGYSRCLSDQQVSTDLQELDTKQSPHCEGQGHALVVMVLKM